MYSSGPSDGCFNGGCWNGCAGKGCAAEHLTATKMPKMKSTGARICLLRLSLRDSRHWPLMILIMFLLLLLSIFYTALSVSSTKPLLESDQHEHQPLPFAQPRHRFAKNRPSSSFMVGHLHGAAWSCRGGEQIARPDRAVGRVRQHVDAAS